MGQSLIALVSGFAITVMFLPLFIGYLRMKDEGQQIREEGPKWHAKKAGTPTMGGLVFSLAAVISVIWVAFWQGTADKTLLVLVIAFLGFALIGFFDDGIGLLLKRNLGLRAYQKLLAQIVIALIVIYILFTDQFSFTIAVPFIGTIDSIWFYAVFTVFWIVGFSNAVNLSDGIDGLASGLSIIAYGTYAIIAYQEKNLVVLYFTVAVVGALLGFLLFNKKPAKIFMGDVGSLALGGGLALVSLLLNRPWSLVLIGIVFVLETLSVILQVISFKTTGKRLFKMTPIHHHFEMSGFSEWQVDFLFWAVGLVGAIIYLVIF